MYLHSCESMLVSQHNMLSVSLHASYYRQPILGFETSGLVAFRRYVQSEVFVNPQFPHF